MHVPAPRLGGDKSSRGAVLRGPPRLAPTAVMAPSRGVQAAPCIPKNLPPEPCSWQGSLTLPFPPHTLLSGGRAQVFPTSIQAASQSAGGHRLWRGHPTIRKGSLPLTTPTGLCRCLITALQVEKPQQQAPADSPSPFCTESPPKRATVKPREIRKTAPGSPGDVLPSRAEGYLWL